MNATDTESAIPALWGPMRLFTRAPVSVPVVAAGLLGAYLLVAAVVFVSQGASEFSASRGSILQLVFFELLQGTIFVYLLTAEYLGWRGARRDLEELRDHLECDTAEFDAILGEAFAERHLAHGLLLAATFVFAFGMVELDPAIWTQFRKPPIGSSAHSWAVVRNTLVGLAMGRLVLAEVAWIRAFVSAGLRARVQLPQGTTHEPFVRKGLRSTMTWLVFSSLFSLFWLGGSPSTLNPVLFATSLSFATAALLLPMRQLKLRLAAAKRFEIRRIDVEIERERDALFAEPSPDGGRMASLVAWRGLVEAVREWPLSVPNLFRFGLFILLGLGSWLGGALVERGLDTWLN